MVTRHIVGDEPESVAAVTPLILDAVPPVAQFLESLPIPMGAGSLLPPSAAVERTEDRDLLERQTPRPSKLELDRHSTVIDQTARTENLDFGANRLDHEPVGSG